MCRTIKFKGWGTRDTMVAVDTATLLNLKEVEMLSVDVSVDVEGLRTSTMWVDLNLYTEPR